MTCTRTCATLAGVIVLAAALTACGGPMGSAPTQRTSSAAPDLHTLPSGEVWTRAMVRQGSPSEDPVLCVGGIMESYPPQCAGHVRLVGWDWGEVTNETVVSGITWVDTTYVTGTFEDGTFTLTRPPTEFPPPGAVVESRAATDELPPAL